MTAIAKATRRVRTTKGSCYLTHGSDSYDKKGLAKARRAFDKAVIAESTEEATESLREVSGPATFRIVVTTQVRENYGAHCWDGEGQCPVHWKYKGGNEYHRNIGTANDVLLLGSAGIKRHLNEMLGAIERDDEYYIEYMIDWVLVPTTKETCEERELREMREWGMICEDQYNSWLAKLRAGV